MPATTDTRLKVELRCKHCGNKFTTRSNGQEEPGKQYYRQCYDCEQYRTCSLVSGPFK